MTDVVIKEKVWCKSLWLSSEAILQKVFCANNTTWDSAVLWSQSSVLRQVCTNLEDISKIRWSSEEVVVRVFMQHKDSKGKCATPIVREAGKHFQNLLSRIEEILPMLPSHHRNNQK